MNEIPPRRSRNRIAAVNAADYRRKKLAAHAYSEFYANDLLSRLPLHFDAMRDLHDQLAREAAKE